MSHSILSHSIFSGVSTCPLIAKNRFFRPVDHGKTTRNVHRKHDLPGIPPFHVTGIAKWLKILLFNRRSVKGKEKNQAAPDVKCSMAATFQSIHEKCLPDP